MSRFAPAFRLFSRPSLGVRAPGRSSPSLSPSARSIHSSPIRRNPESRSHLLPEFSLADKVVVVSGGGRGLGLVQAEALLEAGARVHCIDRLDNPLDDPESDFSKVAKRAQDELGTSLSYHQMDVRDEPSINEAMAQIASEHNRLDGLIAAAGINYECPALDYPPDEVERILSINVSGVFLAAQAAARQMVRLKQPGSICLIASMSGTIANRGMFAPLYNTSKSGVIQMGRSLAAEWGQYGIRVNTLSPGYILTKMLTMLFDDYPEREGQWSKENMLGRFSLPKEYRGAAIFLLSDASSYMTGSDLRIDGGHAAW